MLGILGSSQAWQGGLLVVVGMLLAIFRKPFARLAVGAQNETWGFKFGESEIRTSEFVALLLGIVSVVVGVLMILDYNPFW